MDENEFMRMFSPPADEDLTAGLALVPQRIRDALPRTEECSDNVRRVKLQAPWNDGAYAGWCWYVISVDGANDNLAFCYVEGLSNEYGDVRLDHIASIRGPRGQRVVRVEGYHYGATGTSRQTSEDLVQSGRPQKRKSDGHGYEFWQSATVEDALRCIGDGADSDKILLRAASHSPNPSVIEALCEAGATVHFVDENYKTALHQAASFNSNPEIISTLASLGADVDARDWEGRTPLHDAAQFTSEPGIIKALVQAGADIASRTSKRVDSDEIASEKSPLHLAAGINGCLEVTRALLDAGADVNQRDAYNMTPLHACVDREGPVEAIELLLKAGADVEAETIDRHTPLQEALMAGNQEAYDALTNAGAEPNAEMEAWMQEFLESLERSGPDERPPRAKGRLVQTFKFLKELAELRNPVQRDLDDYSQVLRLDLWPVHPCIAVRRGDPSEENDQDTAGKELEPIIRITRAKLTRCPKPPQLLKEWLKPGWDMVKVEVDVIQTRNFRDEERRETVTVGFSDDDDRVVALNNWKATRTRWVEAERPAVSARQLFEKVYALWTTMQREGDRLELVVADGMLCVEEHLVKHPVLLQRISLDFDPSSPEFRFFAGTEKVELHRALLRLVPTIEGKMIAHFDQELEAEPVEPLGGEGAEGFFRRLVQGLFNDGEFLEGEAPRTTDRPCLWREPVIFVRPRTAGLSMTLDCIIEDLEDEATEAPEGLGRIVGVEVDVSGAGSTVIDEGENRPPPVKETDILFSKPANTEQFEIAARLEKAKSVVVQGPPGTGKTHTIANLLGHLLSEGKTVLVTAHTTKALRILRRQMDEALQPLCLSVLEGDSKSQGQLSQAAQEIAHRLSGSDPNSLRREATVLRGQRKKLLNGAETLQRQLRAARFSEIDEIVVSGEALSPIDVAKRVKAGSEENGWIPGPLEPGILCSLTDSEVRDLYASQSILTADDETQLAVAQPGLVRLVTPADFRLRAGEQAGANSQAQTHRPEFWEEAAADGYTAAELQQLHQRVQSAASTLAEEQTWLREALYAGWTGGELSETWQDLLGAMETLSGQAEAAHRLAVEHGPELPKDQPVEDVFLILTEIVDFMESGGRFGFKTKLTKRNWHQLTEVCKVEGRTPRTLDEFRALRATAQLEQDRERFIARWRRLVEKLDGPSIESLGNFPERIAQGYALEIRKRLEWRTGVWEPLIAKLRKIGFRWTKWLESHPPEPGDHGELARVRRAGSHGLISIIEAQAALLRQAELSGALQEQRTYLSGFPRSDAASVMLQAQDDWNIEIYEESCRELARLDGLRNIYEERLALLAKLRTTAPAWARAIAQREEPHHAAQPPADPDKAWRWRQWHQELERRADISMDELQDRLHKIELNALELSARIIEHETWAAQCDRTGLEQQQALMGFVQTMRKVGKGTGKQAPELLRQARQLLTSARRAVPVWIMPLNRVYESFNPRETKFDVVIIDEASQSDVTALAALYLGRTHIVVGDKEQVTPDAIGQRIADVQRLIAADLQGIPNSHLYDGQTSIYDLAEAAFGGVVALREHFRCVPEIIQFSNHLSYNNTIRPLREPFSASVQPALVPQRVNGYRESQGKSNKVEAEEVASLITACLEDPAYAKNELGEPTSFGVISLLGDEQAYLIESKLRERLAPDVFTKHRLLCGNAAQFQGDERDVVFLSMVDGPPDNGKLTLRDAGPKDLYKKRYNVAVSRARNQLWVIHSLGPDDHLKSGDLRRRLIEHARDPHALLRTMEEQGRQTESEFEKLVLERLLSAGYRVRPQWPVGAYRIDLVVDGNRRRLAVECDGERWHTSEQLQNDLERQAVLQRLGWVFARIRGSLFFRDPDRAMKPVFAKLEHLGIEPLGTVPEEVDPIPGIKRLRRRAETLRREWAEELREVEIQAASAGFLF